MFGKLTGRTHDDQGESGRVGRQRRGLLWAAVAGALVTTFGTLTSYAVAFLMPVRRSSRTQRVFLGFASSFQPGTSRVFDLPSGDRMVVVRTEQAPPQGIPFRAYSDRCPHLGCRVHYVASEDHYFCPCHQGVFDANGIATAGPPAQARQSLAPYHLAQDGNSLYAVVQVG